VLAIACEHDVKALSPDHDPSVDHCGADSPERVIWLVVNVVCSDWAAVSGWGLALAIASPRANVANQRQVGGGICRLPLSSHTGRA
jgi:hypothetical protein